MPLDAILAIRLAGGFQLGTVALAHFTPIPRNWDENLAALPDVHRRFASAQNAFIGGVMVFAGLLCLLNAPALANGSPLSRSVCAGVALWWGARLLVLPWLRVGPELSTPLLRLGFAFLHVECAAISLGFGWLAFR